MAVRFITTVFSRDDVRALCKTLNYFHSNLGISYLYGARLVHMGIGHRFGPHAGIRLLLSFTMVTMSVTKIIMAKIIDTTSMVLSLCVNRGGGSKELSIMATEGT